MLLFLNIKKTLRQECRKRSSGVWKKEIGMAKHKRREQTGAECRTERKV
jgi:hypothetical protein